MLPPLVVDPLVNLVRTDPQVTDPPEVKSDLLGPPTDLHLPQNLPPRGNQHLMPTLIIPPKRRTSQSGSCGVNGRVRQNLGRRLPK